MLQIFRKKKFEFLKKLKMSLKKEKLIFKLNFTCTECVWDLKYCQKNSVNGASNKFTQYCKAFQKKLIMALNNNKFEIYTSCLRRSNLSCEECRRDHAYRRKVQWMAGVKLIYKIPILENRVNIAIQNNQKTKCALCAN